MIASANSYDLPCNKFYDHLTEQDDTASSLMLKDTIRV